MNTLRAGGLLGWMLLAGPGLAVALSEESSNPYAVISERNVFHLNPIPPPPEVDKPKLDLPVIKLSGFFKTGSQTRALFSSEPKKKDEVRTYFNLAAGEKDGILEVVKIDAEHGKVDILNSGAPATLNLKDDAIAQPPPVAAAAAAPGGGQKAVPPLPAMPGRPSFSGAGGTAPPPGIPAPANPGSLMRPRRTAAPP